MAALFRRKSYSPLVRRQRAAARKALYGSLMWMVVAGFGGKKFLERPLLGEQAWMHVDWAAKPEVDLLRRYIRIDTTQQTGNELEAMRFLAAELASFGVAATVEELPGGRANLWALVEGADPRAIVLHQHVDTDPVPDPSAWRHSPWSADIDGPWLFGRGSFDMKSVGVAQVVALRRLLESGQPLRRSVLLLATSSEEHGSDYGLRWLLLAHPELIARFGVFLTEGGAVEARSTEDIKYWGTETAQRRYVIARFCSARRQRLEELRTDLESVRAAPRLTEPVRAFLAAYAGHRDAPRIRALLADPEPLLRDPGAFAELPRYLQSMFVHEAFAQEVRETGGGFELEVRLLLLPGVELHEALPEILPEWLRAGVAMTIVEPSAPTLGSSAHDPAFLAIQAVLAERYPGVPSGPWLPDGSITDARFVRPLGVPAFGFSPFPVLSTDPFYVGRVNERISLPSFVEGVDTYEAILRRLTN